MTIDHSTSRQLKTLSEIEQRLRSQKHESDLELINRAVIGTANKLGIHPHDLAIYILIRTASIL